MKRPGRIRETFEGAAFVFLEIIVIINRRIKKKTKPIRSS
jgi:hypothetical protein